MWRPIKLPDFRFNPAVRSLAVAACIVGYALLVHHVNATGQVSALGAVLALLPVAALGVTLLRNPTSRNAGLMLVLVAGLIAWRAWPQLERHSALLVWLQDVGLMLFLLLGFGRTLRTSLPQCLRCGCGVPVEPEVNTTAISCSDAICGMAGAASVSSGMAG